MTTDSLPDQSDNTPAIPKRGSERRRAPRVVAGRPGRVRIEENLEPMIMACSIVDISNSGCRMMVQRTGLPKNWTWNTGSTCSIDIGLKSNQEIVVPAQLVWSQRTESGFDILGIRFLDPAPQDLQVVEDFVVQRLHVGLKVEESAVDSGGKTEVELDVPLETEMHTRESPDQLYRLEIYAIRGRMLEARYAPKEGETKRIPPSGVTADLTVLPPLWARAEKRALRFAVQVVEVGDENVRLEFSAAGSDLTRMICDLIPPKIERKKKPSEVDFSIVLIILAMLLIALIIASLSGK